METKLFYVYFFGKIVTCFNKCINGNVSLGTRICIKRKKIDYGKFFDFWADEYLNKRIPEDENPPIPGF